MYIENIKNFVQLLLSSCIHCNINSDETKNPHYPFSSKVNRAWFWGFGGGWLFFSHFSFPQSRRLVYFSKIPFIIAHYQQGN